MPVDAPPRCGLTAALAAAPDTAADPPGTSAGLTTPFDMVMLNDLDRYHLVMDVIDRVGHLLPQHGGAGTEAGDAVVDTWTWPHG